MGQNAGEASKLSKAFPNRLTPEINNKQATMMNTKKTPFEIKTNINYTNKVKGKNHKSDEIYGVCKILHVSSVQRKHLQKLMKQRLAQG